MKTTKLLIVKKKRHYTVFVLLFAFIFSCKEKENKIMETENTIENQTNRKSIDKQVAYKNNLEIINGDSYYDDDSIYLKVPVPNNEFYHLETIDVSSNKISAIVYVITDSSYIPVLKLPIKDFHTSTLDIKKTLKSGKVISNELVVFTVNEHPTSFRKSRTDIVNNFKKQIAKGLKTIECAPLSSSIKKSLDFDDEPKEACGGIIVR